MNMKKPSNIQNLSTEIGRMSRGRVLVKVLVCVCACVCVCLMERWARLQAALRQGSVQDVTAAVQEHLPDVSL